jgi:glycosyltransferase involved in cell wall biosynthesis
LYGSKASPRQRTILYVGRIAREKGVHRLVAAFARMAMTSNRCDAQDWNLRIIGPHEVTQGGDGANYLGQLKAIARPLGSRCEFVGPIFDNDELISQYQAASIFVYPSLAEKGEAFGLAPLEAMAAGCAVIVSDLRCFDDFIERGVSGLKFDHRGRDPEADLASQMHRLTTETGLLEKISAGGYQAACRFKTPLVAARMLEDFKSLASGNSR